jgi:hypothetical protein
MALVYNDLSTTYEDVDGRNSDLVSGTIPATDLWD